MTGLPEKIRIGTRGSPLALKQTEIVCAALARAAPELQTEILIIKTSGDWKKEDGETRLEALQGGKAQFAKEIEEALLAGRIDAAVHSMKDMGVLPEGLIINHMLPREDARDVLIFKDLANYSQNIEGLKQGAHIATASVRRQAFLLARRSDLRITPLRGNVGTRLEKIRTGAADATLLALAGLKRLGIDPGPSVILEPEDMLPAAGQGAVGIEIRATDQKVLSVLDQISCRETVLRVKAERAVLAALGGSCHTPIGAHAVLESDGRLWLRAALISLDGTQIYEEEARAAVKDFAAAESFGHETGMRIRARAPAELLDQRAA